MPARVRKEFLVFHHDGSVRGADRHGQAPGAPHEDTFDHSLPPEAFGLVVGKEGQGPIQAKETLGEPVHYSFDAASLGAASLDADAVSLPPARVLRLAPTMDV